MGYKVAPFKAQNMSNNSYVTKAGGEMGRAQVVQAEAARIDPHVDMNPVLLKPSTDTRAQVIVHGTVLGDSEARDYFSDTSQLRDLALESLNRLRASYDLVIIEGAGSCAELNLRKNDYVNFEMALATQAPTIIVADIDKGGVFAQTLGTLMLLSEAEQELVSGFVINKFRGDAALFEDGQQLIEERSSKRVFGLVSYFRHIDIDSEDGLSDRHIIDPKNVVTEDRKQVAIAVLLFPHISNFTDFAPLERDEQVAIHYLSKRRSLEHYDLLILPGSKNVRSDLRWMNEEGWTEECLAFKGRILGICGGFQILGQSISDPRGLEGPAGQSRALGLIDMDTELEERKVLKQVRGNWQSSGDLVEGYEIHLGQSRFQSVPSAPLLIIEDNQRCREEGYRSDDNRIFGTYVHGVLDCPIGRQRFLAEISTLYDDALATSRRINAADHKDQQYKLLADHFKQHLDISALSSVIFSV